ncbi:MAG: threonine ammonia-lyase [Desulfatiglandales bacterium]
MEPQMKDIKLAHGRFRDIIPSSPMIRSRYLSELIGSEILLKLENLQETGSFKVRGAFNRLSQLSPDQRKKGVIAASAGNHAQGVAWASQRLGIQATIVMPEEVSIRKLLAVREYGTEIILRGSHYDDAYSHALEISRKTGKILIPAFDDPHVIAGQGTIGLEIEPHLENDVAIVVPVGGGGLISGIAISAKALYPNVRIIGVQTNSCPATLESMKQKGPVDVEVAPTLADGIAIKRPGDLTFPIIQRYVDEMVGVDEEGIAGAIMNLLEKVNIIAEGAGATPLAALIDHKVSTKAKCYILVVSGGNIEVNTIDRILQKGSVKMGRLIRIEVNLLDAPGSLWTLLGIIAKEKANILHIFHDRLALENPIEVSRVKLNLETRGHEHAKDILEKLGEAGYDVRQIL